MKWIVAVWGALAAGEWALRHALVATGWGMTLLHAGADEAALVPGVALVGLRLLVVATAPLVAAGCWLRVVAPSRAERSVSQRLVEEHAGAEGLVRRPSAALQRGEQ